MKMAKKSLVLAIVATGTLLGSTGTGSAVASPGDTISIDKIIFIKGFPGTVTPNGKKGTKRDVSGTVHDVGGHLMVENTGTVNPNGKKGTKKASRSRSRMRRAKNAERRRQRQLKRQRERVIDEFLELSADLVKEADQDQLDLLEIFEAAIDEGDTQLACEILVEIAESFELAIDIPKSPNAETEGPVDGSRSNVSDD